jgi:hypothetical protein
MKPSAENVRLAKEIHSRLDLLAVPNTAAVRAIRREFSARIASAAPESVVQLALYLLSQNSDLLRFFCYELVSRSPGTLPLTKADHEARSTRRWLGQAIVSMPGRIR